MPNKKSPRHVFYDLEKRRIYLIGLITPITPFLIERAFDKLISVNVAPIKLLISSEGGDYYATLKIFYCISKVIDERKVIVDTIVVDYANSGAALISQAGKKKFAYEKATIKFHSAVRPFFEKERYNARMHMEAALKLFRIDAVQLFIFSYDGRPVSKIFQLFDEEAEITAVEAKKLKLIDEIIKPLD